MRKLKPGLQEIGGMFVGDKSQYLRQITGNGNKLVINNRGFVAVLKVGVLYFSYSKKTYMGENNLQ
jgi:hypothetical protein